MSSLAVRGLVEDAVTKTGISNDWHQIAVGGEYNARIISAALIRLDERGIKAFVQGRGASQTLHFKRKVRKLQFAVS